MELDHFFVFVPDPQAAMRAAAAAGLSPTHRRVHRGQGTENTCYGFANAYIEFLWCRDRDEIDSAAVARTGLGQRSRWPDTGACPFGVCLRTADPPIETWTYDVPFPPGMSVEMAETSAHAQEPALFFFGPSAIPTDTSRRQSMGARITGLELAFRQPSEPSVALECLAGVATIRDAPRPHMTVTVDGGASGRRIAIPEACMTIVA